jgi:cation diffusion facilitator CzcD-associated flavoprotein CzcO
MTWKIIQWGKILRIKSWLYGSNTLPRTNLRYKEHYTVVSVHQLAQTEKEDDSSHDIRSRFVIELDPTTQLVNSDDNAAQIKQGGEDHIIIRTRLACRNVICCSGQFTVPKIPNDQ